MRLEGASTAVRPVVGSKRPRRGGCYAGRPIAGPRARGANALADFEEMTLRVVQRAVVRLALLRDSLRVSTAVDALVTSLDSFNPARMGREKTPRVVRFCANGRG